MASYLITGANRGIGLELTTQLLELPASQVGIVFAVSRTPATSISDLIKAHPDRVVNIVAEVTKPESVQKAVKEVESALAGAGLDVLVNNAAVSSRGGRAIKEIDPGLLTDVFNVNVLSVQIMTQAFLPLLSKGKEKKVINVSSTMGSVAMALKMPMPLGHSYRVSKAALNMLNALYASELKDEGFTFLLLSPGWLKTDLGGQYADLEPHVGVAEVRRIILEAGPSMNGKFVNIRVPGWDSPERNDRYDGGEIPF